MRCLIIRTLYLRSPAQPQLVVHVYRCYSCLQLSAAKISLALLSPQLGCCWATKMKTNLWFWQQFCSPRIMLTILWALLIFLMGWKHWYGEDPTNLIFNKHKVLIDAWGLNFLKGFVPFIFFQALLVEQGLTVCRFSVCVCVCVCVYASV